MQDKGGGGVGGWVRNHFNWGKVITKGKNTRKKALWGKAKLKKCFKTDD